MRIYSAIFITLGLLASPLVGHKEPQEISLVGLIGNPDKYDGQTVMVIGFLKIEPEGTTLSLSFEDYEHSISKNSIWIEASPEMLRNVESLDMNYVLLVGTYNSHKEGHMACCSGTLSGITRSMQWSQLKSPRREKPANPSHKNPN